MARVANVDDGEGGGGGRSVIRLSAARSLPFELIAVTYQRARSLMVHSRSAGSVALILIPAGFYGT
jgi:hypothetical protein